MRMMFLIFSLVTVLAASAAVAVVDLPAGAKTLKDIAYIENGHERQKLDLFLPAGYDKVKSLPLVIWVHGGGWLEGSKENCPAVVFLSRGYAVASIGYRLSQHAIWPAQLQDCRAAVRYLKANAKEYNLDVDHVGAWGASAGGHLVAMLGTTADDKDFDTKETAHADISPGVACVLDWFGPTDLGRLFGEGGARNPVVKLLGSDSQTVAKSASPLYFVTKDSAPLLVMHGDKDPLVPLNQSALLEAAYKKAGAPVEFIIIPGAGHGGTQFLQPRYTIRALTFFQEHLKPNAK